MPCQKPRCEPPRRVTMRYVYAFTLTLLFSGFFPLAHAQAGPADYQFDQLKSVTGFRSTDIDGWGRINDQVLVVSVTPSKKYILVLARTDRDLSFSQAIGVTSNGGRVEARFDSVYASNSNIRIENRISKIYEIKGSAAMKHARALFELRDCESQKNADCSSFKKAIKDITVPSE